MVRLKIGRACHKLMLFSNNLLVLGPLKVSLAKAILLFNQVLSSQMSRVRAFLLKTYSHQIKLVHHAGATNHPLLVWFKRRGQTKEDRFFVVFSHRDNSAGTSSGSMSRHARLASLASNSRRQCLLQICHLHPSAIAKIRLRRYVCARRAQIQADGFSNARSHKAKDAISLLGLTNH